MMTTIHKDFAPGTDEWNKVMETDFPRIVVTEKTKEITLRESTRYRGSVRISTGRFWTDEEYEERRKRILDTPLP
ncbi:MAG: hypothetical protein AB1656_12120 [Candidatus Omnitrophota bacterium]